MIPIPPSLRLVLGAFLVALCLVAWLLLSLWLTSLPGCCPHPHSPLPFVLTLPPIPMPSLHLARSHHSYHTPTQFHPLTTPSPVHPHSSHSQRQPLPSFFPQFSPNTISLWPQGISHIPFPIRYILYAHSLAERACPHTLTSPGTRRLLGKKWQSPSSLHQGFNEPRLDHSPSASLITLSVKT